MSYSRHVITDPRQLLEEEKTLGQSYDRKEMVWELKKLAQTLVKHGIYEITQYSRLLKDYGFNSKDIGRLIKYMMQIVSPGIIPSQRVLDKANFSEKNLILTYLAVTASENISNVLRDILSSNFPNLVRKEDLINNYMKLCQDVNQKASNYDQDTNIKCCQVISSSNDESLSESPSEFPLQKSYSKHTPFPGIQTFEFAFHIT